MNRKQKNCFTDYQLAQYVENRVSTSERERFEEHLSTCNFCLQLVIETKKSLWGSKECIVPSGLIEKVIAKVVKSLHQVQTNGLGLEAGNQIAQLWVRMKERIWQVSKEISIILDSTRFSLFLSLPLGVKEAGSSILPIRNYKRTILRNFEIPLPHSVGRVVITLYVIGKDEIEVSVEPVIEREISQYLIVSLCEEKGRVLKSETLKNKSVVCFPLKSFNYLITLECEGEVYQIPLRIAKK